MTCKDCVHYEVCNKRQNSISLDPMKCGYKCPDFKNKANFVELPCKVGDICYPLNASETKLTCEETISRITISERNIIIGYYEHWDHYNHCRKTDNWRLPLRTRILGKGVFLTKEEAEQTLKGGVE